MLLKEINVIKNSLCTARTNQIKLLHKVIFKTEGDRKNRNRLREFSGFNFTNESEDFKTKLQEIQTNFNLNDLVTISNLLCIDDSGNLAELAHRIVTYLSDITLLAENVLQNESDENESENEIEINNSNTTNTMNVSDSSTSLSSNFNSQLQTQSSLLPSNIHFQDIETILGTFEGSTFENIEKWLIHFEEISTLFNLTELHKFIFLKRSLRGKALLVSQSESHITSYSKLKDLLVSEFGREYNSAELHNMLSKRKLKSHETLDEYFFVMKNLCSRGNIEDSALIDYIIKGIPDSVFKKSILFGCTTLSEFRAKLKIYDRIRNESFLDVPRKLKYESSNKFNSANDYVMKPKVRYETNFNDKNESNSFSSQNRNTAKFCFNCGDKTHISKYCINKNKGVKCFNCNNFGHKSASCSQPRQHIPKAESSQVVAVKSNSFMTKTVTILSTNIASLIDTGSEKTLLKENIFRMLPGVSNLEHSTVTLSGLGNVVIKPLGFFRADIYIDNSSFNANVFVVPSDCLSYDCIIGTDVIKQSILTISGNEISIEKIDNNATTVHDNFLVNISSVVDESDVDLTHVTDNHIRSQTLSLIQNYSPCKKKTVDVKMTISLVDEIPVSSCPRRLAICEKKFVEQQISEWLDNGIIRKSTSDFSSPIVLVKKKNNSFRLCVDYRRLNSKTFKQRFPLPVIDDVIDQLHSASVFTTLDLKNAFLHVDVDEQSQKYTSFVTHTGQYEFLKMPYGLSNSPLVFQRYIYNIFRDLINDNTLIIYMDDIIIPSIDEKEGLAKLERVLTTASEYGLELNIKKCHFLQREIDFLGYQIKNGQLYPSPLKTKAVLNFPEPKNIKDVQSYLGLTSYFRKFIKDYSLIAKPLSDLLRKDTKFHFDDDQRNSFNRLKQILSSDPVLCIYNPNSETEIHCDASIDGYGAVLLQKSLLDNEFHPVYYMSKKTTTAERKYCSYELEVLAVIEALKKFRIYVLGIPFKIMTDCNAFASTMNKKELSTKVARWALMLSDFNYTIEHRPGSRMRHVDALSRNPVCMVIQDSFTQRIIESQNTDEHIKIIKEVIKTTPYDDYLIRNNILYKCKNGVDLLVVPTDMQLDVIKRIHEKGHFGRKRCQELLNEQFFIPNMSDKIDKIISNCITCILHNRKYGKQEGELHPLPKNETPLQTFHIDHLGPLESTNKNYKHILSVIDAFTKFVWLYPCKSTSANEVISKLRLQSFVFGNPTMIISDKGPAFTSKEFQDYCDEENIKHSPITTGLPRANGQVERLNSIVISVISKLSSKEPNKWFKYVPKVQQIINSTYQRSIKKTPFELMIGTKMRQKEDLHIIDMLNSATEEQFAKERDNLREEAKRNILKIQQENRKQYNLRRKPSTKYQLGQLVAIKRTQQGPGLKLKAKYLGPYKIIRVKSNDTYDVERLSTTEGPLKTSTCAEYMKLWSQEH